MKIPKKYFQYVFLFWMTLFMGAAISFIRTAQAEGLHADFLAKWLPAFAATYLIVVPIALIVAPIARGLAGKMTAAD